MAPWREHTKYLAAIREKEAAFWCPVMAHAIWEPQVHRAIPPQESSQVLLLFYIRAFSGLLRWEQHGRPGCGEAGWGRRYDPCFTRSWNTHRTVPKALHVDFSQKLQQVFNRTGLDLTSAQAWDASISAQDPEAEVTSGFRCHKSTRMPEDLLCPLLLLFPLSFCSRCSREPFSYFLRFTFFK